MDLLSSAAKADKTSYDYNARAMKVYLRMTRWTDAAEAAKAVRKLDPDDKKGDAAVACYVIACQGMDSKADNVKELLADVKKFDPTNEKGYFEKAYWQQAMDAYQAKQAAGVTDTLAELTGSAKKLANAQTIYGLLALGYAGQGSSTRPTRPSTRLSPPIPPRRSPSSSRRCRKTSGRSSSQNNCRFAISD